MKENCKSCSVQTTFIKAKLPFPNLGSATLEVPGFRGVCHSVREPLPQDTHITKTDTGLGKEGGSHGKIAILGRLRDLQA